LNLDPEYRLFDLDASKVVIVELFYFAFPCEGGRILAASLQSHINIEAPTAHEK
jgi:hypothetical protein